MSLPIYIGDEVTAAGYRLAGLRVRSPAPDECEEILSWACEEGQLILISAGLAQCIPQERLNQCIARQNPPIVVVPDLLGGAEMPDLANTLRRQLGVLE
jgi:vacuolar-type H+-ATPase subunit F/Vma7